MDVNSNINLFTTILGWQFYGVLWSVIVQTGLVFLPIFAMIISTLSEARSSGSLFSVNVDSALSSLEVKVFTLLLVLLVGAAPTAGTTVTSGDFTFDGQVVGDTNTAYDDTFGASPLVDGTTVPVPAWWLLVMRLSNGVTKAVGGTMDLQFEGAFRELEMAMQTAAIRIPQTKKNLSIFNYECYLPARSLFMRTNDNTAGIDVNYQGSEYFINEPGYYDTLRTRSMIEGVAFNPDTSPEYADDPGTGGRPTCNEMWEVVSEGILVEAELTGVNAIMEEYFGGMGPERQAQVVRGHIQRTDIDSFDQVDDLVNEVTEKQSLFGRISAGAAAVGGAGVLTLINGITRIFTNFVIQAAPIVQAYTLMVLYMTIPLGLIVSGYSFKFLVQGAVLIFSVTFWTALWKIAAHADAMLRDTFWENVVDNITSIFQDPGSMLKSSIHQFIVLMLYIMLPTLGTKMLMAGAGSMAGATSVAGGTAGGAASAGSAPGAAVGSSVKQIGGGAGRIVAKASSKK